MPTAIVIGASGKCQGGEKVWKGGKISPAVDDARYFSLASEKGKK